jgi:peptidyl-prolyl cis-trans isomerase SurA
MTSKQKTARSLWTLRLFAITGLFVLAYWPAAYSQSIVVMVNDEPVTSYDVAQRQRFLAMTSGLGDKMRARLKSDQTKEEFRAYMVENQPKSREEAQELQKKFVAKLQQKVIANATGAMRKEAIDQLVEERLMIQAAKDKKIEVTDDEVNRVLTGMAQSGSEKRTLKEFLASFTAQGINPVTLKERIRAQTAWRQLIRQLYGPLVRTTVSAISSDESDETEGETVVDVEIVKLKASSGGSQQAVALRLVEAEEIRKKFSSCSKLGGLLKGKSGVSVQSVKKAKLTEFQGDVKTALLKAKPGDMTPPVIKGNTVETHALCSKTVTAPSKKNQKNADGGDKVQEEFQIYSRRHLKDLRDRALLKYPKKG